MHKLTGAHGLLRGALIAAIAVGSAAGALVYAQDKQARPDKPASKAAATATRSAVADVLMAERLARHGEQTQDPLALIVAARIKIEAGERSAKREFKHGDGQSAGAATTRPDTSAQGLLTRAKAMAKGRADIIAMANEAESARSRGRSEGPHVATSVIRGSTTAALPVQFEGGALAVVGISGDGATDLDLYVFDEAGKRICAAEGNGDDEICRFTPRATSTYRIEVKNLGKIANQFLFVSN